ncbi:MAG TPA: HAD family hydrolase [Candidatus Binatia bacterium]|nr:HAD family hydrolase [Candidatus Binatia bacterium]
MKEAGPDRPGLVAGEARPGVARPWVARLGEQRIEGVLFDYGLTLVTFVRPEAALRRAYAEIAARIRAAGIDPAPSAGTLLHEVHDRVEQEVARHDQGDALEEVDVRALERRAYADHGLLLGEAFLDEAAALAQRAWWEGVSVGPGAVQTLTELRSRGLRLGICSNAPYPCMRAQLEHLGIARLFDSVTLSAEVGWRKPSPRIFSAALAALGVESRACAMVGDRRREDVAGARAAGMAAIRVSEHRDDAGPEDADRVIARLRDLPKLLFGQHTAVTSVVASVATATSQRLHRSGEDR